MANDITNKMYGTGEGVVQQVVGYVPIPAKITSIGANDPDPLIDAFNIDWASGQYSYDGNPTHIIQSTGHLIEVINSKATTSGDVWDDIKDSAYITTQINIYTSSSSKSDVPNIAWQNQIAASYDNMTSYSTLPANWVTSIPNIAGNDEYVWMSAIYKVTSLANVTLGFHGPSSTPIYLSSESGIQGNFKSTVFTRTNSTPASPKQGANYNSGLPTNTIVYDDEGLEITYNSGNETCHWCDGIPANNNKEIIWASSAIITDSTPDETVWTTPRPMSDTDTYDVEFSASTDIVPTDTNWDPDHATAIWVDPGTRKYRNGTDYNGDFSEMRWRAEREMQNGSPLGPWVITKIVGEQGTAGVKGDFKSTVFKRSENIPDRPSDNDGTYDNPIPSGWSDGILNGTGPVWSTWRTFSVNGNNSSWTTPTLVADTPTYDVEFSPNDTKPAFPSNDKNQREGQGWYDPNTTTQVNWEDMIWRAERNRATSQDEWSAWVITKIKGEDGKIGLNSPYFEQRWGVFDKTITPTEPDNNAITLNEDHTTWKLTPQYTSGHNTWMTARKVIYTINNNVQSAQYDNDSTWSIPMRMSGVDGVSQPIQPVLKYQWAASNTNAPQLDQDENGNAGNTWKESPGNPLGENKYLWMIQGQRQNGSMITWDVDGDPSTDAAYWTSPVCLSGPDGQPGKDGDDLEFIYHVYDEVPAFGNDNNNPAYWGVSSQDNYLGPENNEWNDNPTGVTITDKYEYCSYRRKTGNPKAWTKFSTPFPWSIYGENGIDGDGVEYIYAVTATDMAPTQPEITSDNYTDSQQSEWGVDENINGVIWHDDPQQLNNENQKYQWVSTRKYRYPKQNETLGGNALDPNKKYWFNYSTPQLWNWYVNDGTNADRIVMLYKRTNSNTDCGDLPGHSEKMLYTVGTNGWAESPGNNTSANNDDYLWMISNYYSKKEIKRTGEIIYTVTGEWSTPVCLTGEPGHDGEDGSDIEFIYYRTADDNKVPTVPDSENFKNGQYNESDWPFVNLKETHEDINESSAYDSAITKDGIKYLIDDSNYNILEDETISSLDNFENITSDMLHDVWTDNPLGVTSTYDYEYAAVRRKPAGSNSEWGEFSPVFLWSKYGEDGVDGDGVEYIFYRSSNENEVTFNSENNNLPPAFNLNTSGNDAFQKPEVLGNKNWTDDPQGVNETNVWEYVSVRKFREITSSNLNDIPESFRNQVHVGDKIWFPYSEPALWSKYAFDAVASNLTIETDNDMMAVAIDGQNTTRNASSNSAQVFLYHNLLLLSSDKYDVSIVSSNCDQRWLTITNTDNKWKITIDIPEDTLLPADGSFNFTIKAKVKNDNTSIPEEIRDAERFYTFKVIGLSLSTIYQLKTDKIVIHRDINNALENVNATMFNISDINDAFTTGDTLPENFYIFAKPIYVPKGNAVEEIIYDDITYGNKLFSKNNNSFNIKLYTSSDTTKSSLTSVEFNLIYTSNADDTERIINSFTSSGNGGSIPAVQPYTSGTLITNGVIVDRETVSVISDGAKGNPGTDSKSQEYIYFVTDDISYFENGNHANINPNNWDTHENVNINGASYYAYLTDDFPFVNGQTTYLGWEDTHIGISEEHPYQFMSTREYNTTTKEWGKFSIPTCSHNWGHSGEDGDGVEYIYYLCDEENKQFDRTNNPQNWINDTDYQNSEYIRDNSGWTDNPSGVEANNKYEYVSVRKYTYTNNNLSSPKQWQPYSEPTLWAKYGEKGATGDPGGSGLTFDFDNPSIQIAVNSNGRIKDYQEVTTYLNVYEGASKIHAKDITLSIISNGTHAAFEQQYNDEYSYGYTLFNSNSSDGTTYYTWKIGDVDIENIGDNDIVKLTENSSIEFNINYKGNDYVKRVSLVPIKYGQDGANAVVFDLYCPTSVIHYNAMDNTPSFNPTTISDIKVRKIENSNIEYIITDGNNGNKNGFAISYYAILPLADSQEIGGNTGSSEEGTIGRKSSPQLANNIFGYTYDGILDINNKINTALNDSRLFDIPKTVKLSLYHTENDIPSLWDETDLEIIYDGINGTDSFAEEFIYSITYVPGNTSGGEDPSAWSVSDSQDFNSPDFIKDGQDDYWKDHPQGVSLEHPIEWMSHRTYDIKTKTWNRYESPVKWSHWGSDGKDGDGVEYIYWRRAGTAKKTWIPNAIQTDKPLEDPRIWDTGSTEEGKNGKKFQDNEYLGPTGSPWTDNPTGVTAENSYEYVSQRKYNGTTKSWGAFSMPAVWTHYGQKGDTGNPGTDAIVLDWTNDQINLAVDGNGIIKPNQNKSTILTLLNSGSLTIDNLNCYNYDEEHFVISLTNSAGGEGDIAEVNDKINIYSSYSESDKDFTINISIARNFNEDITIPENGLEVTFTVTLSDHTTISKVLKICGQHNGENAVSYEIVPSANAIYRNNSLCTPSQISYVVNKYDGTSVSKVSTFSDSFYAAWKPEGGGNSSSIGTSVLDISSTSSDIGISTISYINLELISNNVVIDRETIPIIDNGEKGAQGFTGAVVRMRGEWASNAYYGNGNYNKSSNTGPQYDGTSILYKDIVIYNNKYWTPKNTLTTYLLTNNVSSGLCKGSAYAYGTIPSTAMTSKWTEATQYDFIATKLLYADQALINQISSHDFIATTQNGTPVAGMTSGKKEYGKDNVSLSLLNNANGGDINTGGDDTNTLTDTSHVRIFAGQIWNNNNSYSLTYAPFNVRQDGTAYMSKANIVGDVNIGGNVNISGDNVNMSGHLSANTLSLGRKSFYYNENVDLPAFSTDQHKVIYAMFYSTETFEIIPKSDSYLWLVRDDSENNGFYSTSHAGDSIQITDKALYTLYSGCGNNPVVSGNPTQKFWIITKNNLFVTHVETSGVTDYVPASISIDITDCIEINSVEFKKVGSSGNAWNSQVAFVTFGFLKNQNVMPESETREYKINNDPTSFTFNKKESVNITLNLSENWTLVSQVNINQWGNVSQWGETLLWNNDNINNLTNHNKYKYVSKIPQNATDNIEGYPSFYIDKGTIEPEGGMCLEFYRNGTSNSNDFGANEFKNDLHIVSASLRLSRSN